VGVEELLPEERKALALLAEGWPQDEIAEAMGFSPSIVKNILVRARRKLGANNAHHAVSIALREKLLG
jgi:DNA-binding CsgD family transcriptional regulator